MQYSGVAHRINFDPLIFCNNVDFYTSTFCLFLVTDTSNLKDRLIIKVYKTGSFRFDYTPCERADIYSIIVIDLYLFVSWNKSFRVIKLLEDKYSPFNLNVTTLRPEWFQITHFRDASKVTVNLVNLLSKVVLRSVQLLFLVIWLLSLD